MRSVAIVFVVVASLGVLALNPAEVRANPIAIEMMIDFDPPNMVFEAYPAPYTTVDAYVVADFTGWVEGINMVAFRLAVPPETGTVTGFSSSNPIVTISGDWETGIIVATSDCIDTFPATLGYLSIFYMGVPGRVRIESHLDLGNVYTACDGPTEEYEYCYVMDGAIGMSCTAPRDICANPVQDVTWAAVKSLYR
ncbi:MAG: hypothetical protein JXA57_07305 [Armatimonadetes bacterium]|nr:hypothetical protein [Armatimonadota bacterium]